MKNAIYAVIIVVCLVAATVVVLTTRSASRNSGIPSSRMTWVKCLNCGDAHQMSLKGFWKLQKAEMAKKGGPTLYVTCIKCGKEALAEAFKCPKCGEVSRKGSPGAADFEDRCPKCKFSQMEADAKAKAEKEQG